MPKTSVRPIPDSYEDITNPDGTYTINKITYENIEIYMKFLNDDNADNYAILDGIVYPLE